MEDYPRSVAELETILKRRRQSPSELLPRVHLVASLLNAGYLEPIKVLSVGTTWPTISTNSPSGSTVVGHVLGASCSIACFNRLSLSHLNPTKASSEVPGTSGNHNILGLLESTKYPNLTKMRRRRASRLPRTYDTLRGLSIEETHRSIRAAYNRPASEICSYSCR